MKLSTTSQNLLTEAVKKAIGHYQGSNEQTIVTDIHLQPIQSSGELTIFDDDDQILAQAAIEEWITYEADDFYECVECQLTPVLNNLKKAGAMDSLTILKPFSFVLIDDERETVADLLLIDDDTLLVSDDLLKGLDEELDSFLKELLEK